MTGHYRLITIGPSHFCEKVRWALDRLHAPYREESHFPLFHWRATYAVKAGRQVPVLVMGERALSDSTDILSHLDQTHDGALYPSSIEQRVRELEDRFDETLGPASRRIAYYHLLPAGKLMHQEFGSCVSPLEYHLFPLVLPLGRLLLKRGLKLNPTAVERSRRRVQEIFDEVEQLLAHGHRYLLGEHFTAADLTFAALAAPLLAPEEHGAVRAPLSRYPAAMRDEIEHWRKYDAGRYALRLYQQDRWR